MAQSLYELTATQLELLHALHESRQAVVIADRDLMEARVNADAARDFVWCSHKACRDAGIPSRFLDFVP